MKYLGRIGVLGAMLLTLAAPGWARVRILNASLSPQILLEIYRSHQNNLGSIEWVNPEIFLLSALSDAASAGQNLTFQVEITDGGTLVASVSPFRVLSRPLTAGANQFNANDIGASGLTLMFNDNYKFNADKLGTGSILPMNTFQVVIRPIAPTPGDPIVINLSLFTPASAFNQPPIPIYPKDVEVNTVLPNFAWTSVAKATAYEVTVGPDPNPDVNTYWRSGRSAQTQALYPPSARALENGQKYYWQVRAFDGLNQPVGGVDGRSQPASFRVNSSATATSVVSPAQVEEALKAAAPGAPAFAALAAYQPVAIETTSPDLPALLHQLHSGKAKVISITVE